MDVLSREEMAPDKASTVLDVTALAASPRVKPDGGYLPPMVSYAQNFEDVMLRRALQDVERGVYVDIGAADPDVDSVTRWFYENGWRGINVEPHPQSFGKLEERRLEDRNLQCVIGAVNANIIFSIATTANWSTGSAERVAEIASRRDVTTRPILASAITLDQLLTLSCGRVIDFLKIDAEGMEDDIFSNASFVSYRPRIIVVEATLLNNQIPSHQVWEPNLLYKGYRFAWFDGLNRFYVREEDEWRLEFFKAPPCVFDNFFAATIGSRIGDVREQAARAEADLTRALASSHAEICETQRKTAETAERYEAALSGANAKATAADARAEAVEGELQRITAEFERQKADLEVQLQKLVEREGKYQQLKENLAQRDCDCHQLEESLAQWEREYQQLEESLAERDREIALLSAERDRAAAQSLHWFVAAIPEDWAGLDCRQRYPFQTRLYRNRLGRWLATGLKRHRRVLIAAAKQASDRQNWGLAARYYREALDLAPDRPALWVRFGHALKETGKIVEAEFAYRRAVARDSRNSDALAALGWVLRQQGREAEAAAIYRHALEFDPSPELHTFLCAELTALGS